MYKSFLFLILYLPFQLALNPAQDIDLASIRVVIIFLFFLWIAQGLKDRKIVINASFQTALISSFLVLNLFSIVVAKNTDWSIRKLLFLFSVFPIYFVSSWMIADRKRFLEAVRVIVLGGFLAASIGIVQFIFQFIFGVRAIYIFWAKYIITPFLGSAFGEAVLKNPSWLVNISGKTYLRATSLFPDPHMFSFYLGLVLPLACGMFFHTEKRKALYGLAFVVIFLADIFTFSRGGYVGLSAGFIFASIFFWNKIKNKYKIVAGGFLMLIAMVLIIPSPISQRFLSSFNAKEGSNQGRLEMWKTAMEVVVDNPIIGVGIGNYPLEVSAVADYRDPIYAHNTYLDIAAETGVINAIVWSMLLISVMLNFLAKARKNPMFFFVLVGIVIFASHSLFETAIYSPVVLTLFLIIISFSQLKEDDKKIF